MAESRQEPRRGWTVGVGDDAVRVRGPRAPELHPSLGRGSPSTRCEPIVHPSCTLSRHPSLLGMACASRLP
uniref:Uncharacterized protein n=1 Tax=Arundo donax TaxID=35708 RepID=A0A0A8Z9W3_ARUDO